MVKVRVVSVSVDGRPAMVDDKPMTPAEHVAQMSDLLHAAFSMAGVLPVVDRTQVRIIRTDRGEREDEPEEEDDA
jgi:hypothetical protein